MTGHEACYGYTAFFLLFRNSPKLSFADWNKYLDEIAKNKGMEADAIKEKLVASGAPGFTGATVS